ncbi:MAG: aminopeptidase [Pseudomonadaceae bacterium]|nr:aminopeptidase [Pseudomonadaceae bacterium]
MNLPFAALPAVLLGLVTFLPGCYYQQAVTGQIKLLSQRERVDTLIADDATAPELRARLQFARDAKSWVESELGFDGGRRYDTFVELDAPYVVWNVVAAPATSVVPKRWCYPVAGCVAYRGYFHQPRAQRFADKLAADGYDVLVQGTTAYSTLGWFADPLLSTFINRRDDSLLGLIAHELAHAELWVPSAASYNEAFASFVEQQARREWLQQQGRDPTVVARSTRLLARARGLLQALRDALADLYSRPLQEEEMLARKRELFAAARDCYRATGEPYSALFDGSANNARIASVATYWRWLPAFERMFELSDRQWPAFVEAATELGSDPERDEWLARLAEQQKQQRADDERADHIQCETLANHAGDIEPTR